MVGVPAVTPEAVVLFVGTGQSKNWVLRGEKLKLLFWGREWILRFYYCTWKWTSYVSFYYFIIWTMLLWTHSQRGHVKACNATYDTTFKLLCACIYVALHGSLKLTCQSLSIRLRSGLWLSHCNTSIACLWITVLLPNPVWSSFSFWTDGHTFGSRKLWHTVDGQLTDCKLPRS